MYYDTIYSLYYFSLKKLYSQNLILYVDCMLIFLVYYN